MSVLDVGGFRVHIGNVRRRRDYPKILDRFTVKHVQQISKTRCATHITKLYFVNGDWVWIARFAALKYWPNPRVVIPDPQLLPIDREILLELRKHQQVVAEYLIKEVYNPCKQVRGSAGCVLKMKAGSGKSYLAAELIHRLGYKTLILIPPNGNNSRQFCEVLEKIFPTLSVVEYNGSSKKDGDIVIMLVSSALDTKYFGLSTYEYFSKFGLVIYDEIHGFPSPKRGKVFWRTNTRCVFGMTATPDLRRDGMDPVYKAHIGPLIDAETIPGFTMEDAEFNGRVEAVMYYGPKEYTKHLTNPSTGLMCSASMEKQFMADPHRNKIIVDRVCELAPTGRNIFIMTNLRDHIDILADLLDERKVAAVAPERKNTVVGKLRGQMAIEDIREACETAQIILITYKYGKESLSLDRFDTIIFASPRRSFMEQIVGRIERLGGDQSVERIVIDIVDAKTGKRGSFDDRRDTYKAKGYKIQYITHKIQ